MEKLSGPEQPDLRAFRSTEKYTQACTQLSPLPSSLPGQLCKSHVFPDLTEHTQHGPGWKRDCSLGLQRRFAWGCRGCELEEIVEITLPVLLTSQIIKVQLREE